MITSLLHVYNDDIRRCYIEVAGFNGGFMHLIELSLEAAGLVQRAEVISW